MIGIAAIGVTHWHSLYDAAYLPLLQQMPEIRILAVQDSDAAIAAERAAAIDNPPIYTDYRQMLVETKPDFVIALGRPTDMASTAHYLLDHGYPFLMEKPMGFDAQEVRGVAEKARATGGFAAVPFPFRYQPQIALARQLIAEGRLGPLSHISIRNMRPTSGRYSAWGAPWMLDPAVANGGCLRNLGPHGLDTFTLLTGENAEVTGAQLSSRGARALKRTTANPPGLSQIKMIALAQNAGNGQFDFPISSSPLSTTWRCPRRSCAQIPRASSAWVRGLRCAEPPAGWAA